MNRREHQGTPKATDTVSSDRVYNSCRETMTRFKSAREAKAFLVARIVEQAKREDLPLSEVERKMLYFSETHWTLPDMLEVNQRFDHEYNQDEYEKKIAELVRNATEHDRKESPEAYGAWQAAVRILEKEDHYILVMINLAPADGTTAGVRPRWDQLKLFIAGVLIAAVLVGFPLLRSLVAEKYARSLSKYSPFRESIFLYVLVICTIIAIVYRLGWLTLGRPTVEDLPSISGDKFDEKRN